VVEGPLADDGWPSRLERGVAGLAIEGEENSGDLAVFAPYRDGGLVAVIDGLGHGDEAAAASATAAEVIRTHSDDAAKALLERCHAALRKSRGVVMTLAWFDLRAMAVWWVGVGNVEARFVRGASVYGERHDSALVLGGVVGYNLPAVRPARTDLARGDAVAFATDGIDPNFAGTLTPHLPAQRLADRIFQLHHKGTDDALAVVVRYVGE
jgi:phosphoserine phosphatase RsbX